MPGMPASRSFLAASGLARHSRARARLLCVRAAPDAVRVSDHQQPAHRGGGCASYCRTAALAFKT